MAMSDKQLVAKARRQKETMVKYGINNDTLKNLENQLDIFYEDFHVKRTSKSGISITQKMGKQGRQEMRRIIRQFINSPDSGIEGIEKEYKKLFERYSINTKTPKVSSNTKVLSPKEMAKGIDYMKNVLQSRYIASLLDSGQKSILYHETQQGNNIDSEEFNKALNETIKEDIADLTYNDVEDISDDIYEYDNIPFNYKAYSDDEFDLFIDRIIAKVKG